MNDAQRPRLSQSAYDVLVRAHGEEGARVLAQALEDLAVEAAHTSHASVVTTTGGVPQTPPAAMPLAAHDHNQGHAHHESPSLQSMAVERHSGMSETALDERLTRMEKSLRRSMRGMGWKIGFFLFLLTLAVLLINRDALMVWAELIQKTAQGLT